MDVVHNLEKEIKRLKAGMQEILDRFVLFGTYTMDDYHCAMNDLAHLKDGLWDATEGKDS